MNYPYKTTKIINKRRFPTYQLHARTINESLPPEKVMCICILETFAWLRGRLSQYENIPKEICLPEPDDYDKFDMGTLKSFQLNLGFSLDIVYSEKDKLWAFCLSEDDMGANLGTPTERKPVVGRNFETNIAFRVIDKYVEVGFRTVCSEPSDTTAVCEVFRPSVVKALFRNKNVGLRHIINITDSPINITSTKDVQRIKEAVFDRQRELPIVVVTQPAPVEEKPRMPKIELPTGMGVLFKTAGNVKDYSTNLIIDREKLGLKVNVPVKPEKANVASQISESQEKAIVQTHIPDTVDVDKIAYSAASFAFVCKVDDGLFDAVCSAFGQTLEKGDILILYKDGASEVFRFSDFSKKLKDTEQSIKEGLTLYPVRRNIEWGNILFTSDARIFDYQNRRSEKLTVDEENTLLKAEVDELHRKLKNAEEQTRDVNANADEIRRQAKEISTLRQELEYIEEDKQALIKSLADVKAASGRMLPSLDFYRKKASAAALFPTDKDEVAKWIESEFSETIYLHRNAVLSLKKYLRSINMAVLCDGIYFLNGYALHRQGLISGDELALYAEEYNWEVQGCGKEALKMFQNDYSVPMESGNKELSLHIKYGVNPQHWVRIYFYYDEKMRKVVIGYMPDHLPTISDKT